jgi:ketosteroid isomerase-like protein
MSDDELTELLRRTSESVPAFMRGDMRRWHALQPHSSDYTLMPPFGGVRHGFDPSDENLDALAAYFRDGDGELEVVQTEISGGLALIVGIERQHGVVGDLPAQDCSLRVTLVYRREDGEWRLLHRHADVLVREVDLARLSALGRE